MELYEWQKKAIDYFLDRKVSIFEVPTGTGKTIVAIEIIKRLIQKKPDLKVLIIVPMNVILESTWYKELYDNGIPLQDIGVFYGDVKEYSKITLTNIQSISKIPLEQFDFCIYDELHHMGTSKLMEIVEYPFMYKLGLSATIKRSDDAHNSIIQEFEGNVFNYSPKQALKDGVLNPFNFVDVELYMEDEHYDEYIIIEQQLNAILQAGGGYRRIMRKGGGYKKAMLAKMNERKKMVNNYFKKFDVVKILCDKHKKNKIVVFNEFNSQTSRCYWNLIEDDVQACIIHSGIKKEKRKDNLTKFKNGIYNVVLTTRVLDEGWNVPSIDVGIIMAGNSTSRQTVQRMGRVLRKKDKKSVLYQVYVKNTVEERYALKRAEMFKELCSNYKKYVFNGKQLEVKV